MGPLAAPRADGRRLTLLPAFFIPLTFRQVLFYGLFLLALLLFYAWDWKVFITLLAFVLCGFYGTVILFRLSSVLYALFRAGIGKPCEHRVSAVELAALEDAGLPVYTVLVPMYKEPEVAQKIARAVTELDYPLEKLDVKLLLEEDDPETRRKVEEVLQKLPACVEVIVCPQVPKGQPRTKPRACNWGLERARGEFLVIFDAEDRPEGDQLKKAVATFRKLRAAGNVRVVCLQAKLNYFNARQNALTKFFTLEYTTWFDLFLPGLHAFHVPIPLGGTSNHFQTAVLKAMGGWDPFNVTEDCDLGVRMARQGYRTEVLDSTTWEEANSRVGNWVRQRSRWIKGYFQTHLVHTRGDVLPAFLLAALFFYLRALASEVLDNPDPELAVSHEIARVAQFLCLAGGLASAGLGCWALAERVRRLARGSREGRLNACHALAFRLTVGGMSAMLILNLLFWILGGLYLFRVPLAEALPRFTDRPEYTIDGRTPRQILGQDWKLYYKGVKEERFKDYTLWNTTYKWWVKGELRAETAREIFAAIDPWSFWSQILYPVVLGLFLANFIFIGLGLVSCAKRGLWDLAPYALLMPFYWVLISLAALKGAWQLFWNPWFWEKTVHGYAQPDLTASGPAASAAPGGGA